MDEEHIFAQHFIVPIVQPDTRPTERSRSGGESGFPKLTHALLHICAEKS